MLMTSESDKLQAKVDIQPWCCVDIMFVVKTLCFNMVGSIWNSYSLAQVWNFREK